MKILIWIWCFPQMLVGAIFKKISKAKKVDDYYVISNKYGGSVSLGTYIFICESHNGDKRTLKHEKGHMIQSYILGWLYLIVVGLPSFLWAWLGGEYRAKHGVSYFAVYPENWADKLGGVER